MCVAEGPLPSLPTRSIGPAILLAFLAGGAAAQDRPAVITTPPPSLEELQKQWGGTADQVLKGRSLGTAQGDGQAAGAPSGVGVPPSAAPADLQKAFRAYYESFKIQKALAEPSATESAAADTSRKIEEIFRDRGLDGSMATRAGERAGGPGS